jgi:hypothetical protein
VHLQYYEDSWKQMLHAVAVLLKSKDPRMLLAMDGVDQSSASATPTANASTAQEPKLFFYVVYGLTFEALTRTEGSSSDQVFQVALEAIEGLSRPEVAGSSLVTDAVFDELCDLCFRLIATQSPAVQEKVIVVILELARNYRSVLFESDSPRCVFCLPCLSQTTYLCLVIRANGYSSKVLPSASRSTQCLRIITSVLEQSVPPPGSTNMRSEWDVLYMGSLGV